MTTSPYPSTDRQRAVHLWSAAAGLGAGFLIALVLAWFWQRGAWLTVQLLLPMIGERTADAQVGGALLREAQLMGLPLTGDSQAYWFVARAGGLLGYLLFWFAALWGTVMTSKMAKGVLDPSLIYGMHEFLPILAVVFAAIHALALLGDSYIGFRVIDVLVPFVSSYRPLWTGSGVIGFYLSIALIASFSVRGRIGRKAWRLFHYTTYLAFVLVLLHGLMAGTDAQLPAVRWMYISTGAILLFAVYFRVLTAGGRRDAPTRAKPAERSG